MQPYQTNKASQTDKPIANVMLAQRLLLIKTIAGWHTAAEQPESPAKQERNAFPTPANTKSDPKASFCPTDRLLALYNKQQGKKQQRLTSVVRDWFKEAAHQAGWGEVVYLEDTQTSQVMGCMLRASPHKGAEHA
ncbi:hypothetical protein [Thiopseudomonas alkaliphila]|uniref:hypothetical protein n=1 Tax=Thiopseudomonas alkaliphila TaxID=1697053 RepID=UPI002576911F|nr:hypothetical protein [Thiopseudomonas alkaliphila]MDM1708308.1 hypothetical protein [Thiopseudomonas alkaliphila]